MLRWKRAVVLLLASATGFAGSSADAASLVVKVNAQATKPLSLTRVQDMDFGTIVLAPGTWSGATVSLSQAGVFTCRNVNTSCSGAPQVATYTVSGSNNEVVKIAAPNVTLTNQSDPSQTIVLAIDSPGTVTLENGGKKGTDFSVGGSMVLSSATSGGTYAGTLDITVDY